jgi:hypothetical protein
MAPGSQRPALQTMWLAGVREVRLEAGEGAVNRPSGTVSRMDLHQGMGETHAYGENRSDRR